MVEPDPKGDKIIPDYSWMGDPGKPGPLRLMPEGQMAAEAFSAFSWQEWEGHVRRIAREVLDAEPFPETRASCGCGFEVNCHDGARAQTIMDCHECYYPTSGVSLPDPWHKSLARLGTNVVGWSAIAFMVYTSVARLLEV